MQATDNIKFDAAHAFEKSRKGIRLELLKLLFMLNKEQLK